MNDCVAHDSNDVMGKVCSYRSGGGWYDHTQGHKIGAPGVSKSGLFQELHHIMRVIYNERQTLHEIERSTRRSIPRKKSSLHFNHHFVSQT
eukprot:scaffold244_cov172-Amphora_coffeaeformis.AAC.47